MEQPGTVFMFALIRGLLNNIFAKLLASLHADYFGAKIRKIQPVTKAVEGFKVKVSFFLGHPVGYV